MTNPTCDECGYNLPHHAESCSHAPALTWACPAHRPAGTSSHTDDMSRPPACSTCGALGANGYR